MSFRTNALVGAALRERREKVGLPQASLARAIGLGRSSISNIERGDQPMSLNHLYAAAAVLGTTVHDLLPHMGEVASSAKVEVASRSKSNIRAGPKVSPR